MSTGKRNIREVIDACRDRDGAENANSSLRTGWTDHYVATYAPGLSGINLLFYFFYLLTLDLGFQTDRQHNEIGLIAQELEEVIPQAVTRAPFDNEDNEKIYLSGNRIDGETEPYKTIKMDKVVPLLIEAVKDQQKQIEELKELLNKLTK